MPFDRHDVRRVAALARLELDDDELDAFAPQLGSVLDHVAALEGAGGSEAEAEVAGPAADLRADVPSPGDLVRRPADFAPGFRDGFFTVPRLPAFVPGPGSVVTGEP